MNYKRHSKYYNITINDMRDKNEYLKLPIQDINSLVKLLQVLGLSGINNNNNNNNRIDSLRQICTIIRAISLPNKEHK